MASSILSATIDGSFVEQWHLEAQVVELFQRPGPRFVSLFDDSLQDPTKFASDLKSISGWPAMSENFLAIARGQRAKG